MLFEAAHQDQGDVHGLLHEIGQPHSHDHDDESQFTLSYSKDAVKHINQDLECCITAIVEISPVSIPDIKPMDAIASLTANWSPPFIQHTTPPPRF